MKTIAVVVPVFGQHALTDAMMDDLLRERELVEAVLVDNQGDYQNAEATVLRPGTNLRAIRGMNHGVRAVLARPNPPPYLCLMNNDVRLSESFFACLLEAQRSSQAFVLAPLYDGPHGHQNRGVGARLRADVSAHRVGTQDWIVPFIDGTCMFLPTSVWQRVGELDEESFGEFGWGAELDYAIRVRRAGGTLVVTDRAYLHHVHQATAKVLARELAIDWDESAAAEMEAGLVARYGSDWRNILHGLGEVTSDTLSPEGLRARFASGWW